MITARTYYQADPNTSGGEPAKETPKESEKFPASWEEIFQHPRFRELNQAKQNAEQRLKEIEAKEKEARDKALADENKWKELYEGAQKELSVERLGSLRLRVATSKGLPLELVERLRGETEEEIAKDADELLALVKEPQSRGLPAHRRNGDPVKFDFLTENDPAKIREAVRQGKN